MFVRAIAPLRLAALASLVFLLTAVVPTNVFAQAPCRSPIPPATYAGTMNGTLSMRGYVEQGGMSGLMTMDYHQASDDLLLMIDCDASISGHGTFRLSVQLTLESEGGDVSEVPQNLDVDGSGEFVVDIDGYVVRQPGKEPLLVLTLYPIAGSGEGAVQTIFEQPKRHFDVTVLVRFDVEDLDELLQGEGVPYPLQIGSQEDGALTGEVFDPEITEMLTEAFQDSFGGRSFETGRRGGNVEVTTSGTWRLAILNK